MEDNKKVVEYVAFLFLHFILVILCFEQLQIFQIFRSHLCFCQFCRTMHKGQTGLTQLQCSFKQEREGDIRQTQVKLTNARVSTKTKRNLWEM